MFTLIPPDEKKILLSQYRKRLLFLTISMLTVISLISFFFIVPSYVLVLGEQSDIIQSEKEVSKSSSLSNDQNLLNTLKSLKNNIKIFNKPDVNVEEVVFLINGSKPLGVKITGISYQYEGDGKALIEIEGVSRSRQDLILFSKNLETKAGFKKVDLPISSLAKESDISFILSLENSF